MSGPRTARPASDPQRPPTDRPAGKRPRRTKAAEAPKAPKAPKTPKTPRPRTRAPNPRPATPRTQNTGKNTGTRQKGPTLRERVWATWLASGRIMRRARRAVLVAATLAGLLFLFGFPVRTLIEQQHQMSVAVKRERTLARENAKLAQRAAQLQTTAEIEKIARQQYGLALPGTHAYVVLPPTAPSTTAAPPTTVPSHARKPHK